MSAAEFDPCQTPGCAHAKGNHNVRGCACWVDFNGASVPCKCAAFLALPKSPEGEAWNEFYEPAPDLDLEALREVVDAAIPKNGEDKEFVGHTPSQAVTLWWHRCQIFGDTFDPPTVRSLLDALEEARGERDMYREKAHRLIRAVGSFDRTLGTTQDELFSLVESLKSVVEAAMKLNPRVIPVDSISRLSDGHYRADGANGETTGCYCGIGKDHDEPVPGVDE